MDSDGEEIPASQQTAGPQKPKKPAKEHHRGKHRKLSLGSSKRRSKVERTKSDEQSTSSAVADTGEDRSKFDIYWDGEDDDSAYTRPTIPADYDIYESARIMEMANVPATQEEIRARRAMQSKFSNTQHMLTVRQLLESEQAEAARGGATSNVCRLETQMPGISETQFSSVCNLLDEAHLLVENDFQFSQWPTDHHQQADCAPNPATALPETAQAILDDFDTDLEEDSRPTSPPRLILKKPNRTYARITRKLTNATTTAVGADEDANDSVFGEDIDLNSSFMILKNIADLSVIFESQVQPQKIELELDDMVFEQGSQSGDEPAPSSDASSDSDEETVKAADVGYAMLSDDDSYILEVKTPRMPSTVKRVKRNHESMSTESARPTESTPSTSKIVNKAPSLHPKRLRFESDRDQVPRAEALPPLGFTGGFQTARGTDVGISAAKIKNSAKIFDEILADFDGLPLIDESAGNMPGFSSLAGFKTTHTAAENSPLAVPSTSNGFRTARPADAMSGPSTSFEFKTPGKVDKGLPRIEAAPSKPSTSAGFTTARGHGIQGPSDAALKKSMKLFESEQDDVSFIAGAAPEKHVKWQDELNAPVKPNAGGFGGFTTAVGTSINVSADTFKRYAALFEEEINEDLLGQCEADTSVADSICDGGIAASPFNKFMPTKFATSTPNVAAKKVPLDQSSITFLDQLDLEQCDEMFTDFPVPTQRPKMSDLSRTCLSDRLIQTDAEAEFNPSMVAEHVKKGRKEALVRQQANCFRKNNVRPQPSALRTRKSEANRMPLKKLGTPKSYTFAELAQLGVAPNVINVDIENVFAFKFEMSRFYSKDECMHNVDGIELEDGIKLIMDEASCAGFDEMSHGFLDCNSVDPKLVPDNWVRNSLKWILLKLAGLERSFPQRYAGKAVTPAIVMMQLKYRYDREIDQSQRSAIRKIVEQDDAASKPLVLFVSRIKTPTPVECTLELSDGWYGIGTGVLDTVLSNATRNGKIRVGTKLLIQDAELIGVEEACSPLEMPSSAALKFSANSTRRVKWYTKLGYFNGGRSIPFPMNSIDPHGGHISKFTAFIARIYPMLFVVKIEQKSNSDSPNTSRTVIRSEKVQRRLRATENQKDFDLFEAICSEVTAAVEREYAAKSKELAALPKRELSEVDDAEELWHLMERSNDAESFESGLSFTQKSMVSTYRDKIAQEKREEIANRVRDQFAKKHELEHTKATPLLKVRIVNCDAPATNRPAVLSIWNANECSFDLRENSFVEITSASANGLRGKDLLITASRRTKIRNIDSQTMTDGHITIRRKCHQLGDIDADSFKPEFNEFDVVAYVLEIGPVADNKFQTVYFVDSRQNLLFVNFWSGLKQYAFDDVIEKGRMLAITNLEWRPMHVKSQSGWPQAFVSDVTTFSTKPQSPAMCERLRQLSDSFKAMADEGAYIGECMSLIHERRDSGNSSSHSATVLSISNSSPMNRTLNTSSSSKKEGAPKSRTKMRMERLKVYKSPPPTPAMAVTRGSISTLRRPFKSPMVTALPTKTAQNQENETN